MAEGGWNNHIDCQYLGFRGRNYRTRIVLNVDDDIWERKIATLELQKQLFVDGDYASDEARYIDEQIFYFIDDNEIILPEDELVRLIKKSI